MKKTAAFWDSSALVPLGVQEGATRPVLSHLGTSLVFWRGSLVEVQNALCWLHRAGEIAGADMRGATAGLRPLSRGWRKVLPDEAVRHLALRIG